MSFFISFLLGWVLLVRRPDSNQGRMPSALFCGLAYERTEVYAVVVPDPPPRSRCQGGLLSSAGTFPMQTRPATEPPTNTSSIVFIADSRCVVPKVGLTPILKSGVDLVCGTADYFKVEVKPRR